MQVRALACLFVCLFACYNRCFCCSYLLYFILCACVRDPQGMINCNKNDRFVCVSHFYFAKIFVDSWWPYFMLNFYFGVHADTHARTCICTHMM